MNALAPLTQPMLHDGHIGGIFVPAANDVDGTRFMQMRAGQTVLDMLGPDAAHSLKVTVGGIELPRELWGKVRPKAGKLVTVEFWPQGQGDGRKWIMTIIAIVATIFSYGASLGYFAGYGIGAGMTVWSAGAMVVAALAISMIPPPLAKLGNGATDPLDQLTSLTGTQNQMNPYGAIPLVLGDWRFYPPHAAMPFTEVVGQDQYLRMLLDLGYGDLDVSDIKIGETDIASYEDVEWEVSATPSLFTQDVYELTVGVALNDINDGATRTTQADTTEISLDLVHPQGLYGMDTKGNLIRGTTSYAIQYKPVGGTTWSNVNDATGLTLSGSIKKLSITFTVQSSRRKALRLGVRWTVPTGQYDVRVVRGGTSWPGATSQAQIGDAQWTVLRSISPQDPSTTGTTKLALRIKATDQLHGVVSSLSARVAQKVRRWDAVNHTWMTPVASTNPAWIYLWMLTQCPGTKRHAADSQIDLDALAHWAADCDAQGYVYAGIADSTRRFSDVAKDVLACGRATAGLRNGKYSVVRDIAQSVPMQVYTPLNGTSLTYSRSFQSPPHVLKVSFTNTQADNQQDERIVYWDGYNENNATHIENLDLRNVTSPEAAWRLARYHLAVMWLRPNKYHLEVDIEHLISERGDLVEIAAPLIGWGVGYGRIRSITSTTITLSEPFAVQTGHSYAVRVRNGSALSDVRTITIAPADIVNGQAQRITLASTIPGMAVDQMLVVGEVNKLTKSVLISAIEPGGNMLTRSAKLTCVDAHPGVWTAADGTPPPFVSSITNAGWCSPPRPPVVHIYAADSAPDNAGVINAQLALRNDGNSSGIFHFREFFDGPRCVAVESYLPDARQAGDVQVGDYLDMADPVTLAPRTEAVTHSERTQQPCVELITASGIVLRCSISAPLPTRDDGLVNAAHVAGKRVAVRDGNGTRWETVARIRAIGLQAVQHISVHDGCFWAGAEQGRFVLHHNKPLDNGPGTHNEPYITAR